MHVYARYDTLLRGRMDRPGDAGLIAYGLADIQVAVVDQIFAQQSVSSSDVSALGVHDPGLWHVTPGGCSGYVSLCDAARIAEQTGLCVVDAFPARDLAGGGQGGPITALGLWMVLRDPDQARIFLDLGRTTRLTYLPSSTAASSAASSAARVLAFDIGPGTMLLDELARRLSEGKYVYDPGGRLAVQGRCLSDLIEMWLKDSYFQQPPPRWRPLGVRPNTELNKTVEMAIESGWSIRDLLCTATHFISEIVRRAVADWLPGEPPVTEVLIAGGGQSNGMLLGEIAVRLPGMVFSRTSEGDMSDLVLESMAVAALTALHVDLVPANHPAITGAASARILGRLTPGTAAAWSSLLTAMQRRAPSHVSLRDAI